PRDGFTAVDDGATQVGSEHQVVHLLERVSVLDVDGAGLLEHRHSRRIPHQARHCLTVARSQRALQLGCERTLTPHTRLSRTTRGLCADGHRRDRHRGCRPGYDSGHHVTKITYPFQLTDEFAPRACELALVARDESIASLPGKIKHLCGLKEIMSPAAQPREE